MREREPEVLAEYLFVVGSECRSVQEARNPGYIVVRKQMCGLLIQESGGDEDFEPLVAVELQNAADAIQHLAAHPTIT